MALGGARRSWKAARWEGGDGDGSSIISPEGRGTGRRRLRRQFRNTRTTCRAHRNRGFAFQGKGGHPEMGFCAKLQQKNLLLKLCVEVDFGKRSGMFVEEIQSLMLEFDVFVVRLDYYCILSEYISCHTALLLAFHTITKQQTCLQFKCYFRIIIGINGLAGMEITILGRSKALLCYSEMKCCCCFLALKGAQAQD